MKPHIERPIPGSDPGHPPAKSRADRIRERRRRFLLGGVSSFSVVTLASKPVLATGQRVCSISAKLSANASRPLQGPCGNTPGCWKNHALSNDASSWTAAGHSPSQPFKSVFTMFDPTSGTNPYNAWSCSPSNATLLDALNGSVSIRLKVTDSTTPVGGFSTTFPAHAVAALLNAKFFGTPAYPLSAQGVMNAILGAMTLHTPYTLKKVPAIRTAIENVKNTFDDYNNSGAQECPVV
jgi:hypothetical protein